MKTFPKSLCGRFLAVILSILQFAIPSSATADPLPERLASSASGAEIAVQQPEGTNLTDGRASVAFGKADLEAKVIKYFKVTNLGTVALTGLAVSKNGKNASDFTVGTLARNTLAAGTSTTFKITFTPSAKGKRSAAIHITSNDANENPFDIKLTGGNGGPYSYTTNRGQVTITGYTGSGGALTIPGMINGLPVTSIGDRAFFGCSGLTIVTIPNSVTSIGNDAFVFCTSLTSVTIPNSVTSIGKNAFRGCSGLASVMIPDSVTSIGDGAFDVCSRLEAAHFMGNAPTLGTCVFTSTADNFTVCYFIGRVGFTSPTWKGYPAVAVSSPTPEISVEEPSGATLGNGGTRKLDWVSVGGSADLVFTLRNTGSADLALTGSPKVAISGSNDYSVLTQPGSATISPGGSTTFTVRFVRPSEDVQTAALSMASNDADENPFVINLAMAEYPFVLFKYAIIDGQVTITGYIGRPSGDIAIPGMINGLPVTRIGDKAFFGYTGLRSVTIPNGVISIGKMAFHGCGGLKNVTIPDSVTLIGDQAFTYCPLASVTIPNSGTLIGDDAFFGGAFASVTIPNSVVSIGNHAFASGRLKAIIVDSLNTVYSSLGGVLFDKSRTTLIEFPWDMSGFYTIPSSVTRIGDGAFEQCTHLTGVTIPNSVTSIGNAAFGACIRLTNVKISNSVTRIGNSAFGVCTGLTNVEIGNSVTTIGDRTFAQCRALTKVTIGNSVTTIGEEAFFNCIALAHVTIPASVTSISYDAFGNCDILREAHFMGDAPFVERRAFGNRPDDVFTIYYFAGSTGFTSPTWNGYRTVGVTPVPEIAVHQPTDTKLKDGVSHREFGSVAVKSMRTKTFTIRNTGSADLSDIAITKTGANAEDFRVAPPEKTVLAPGASTTFKVVFKPSSEGIRKAVIHIRSNDANENPFDITVTGKGVASHSNPAWAKSRMSARGISSRSYDRVRSVTSTLRIHGEKYLCITIFRNGTTDPGRESVEVSTNLVDWFSGLNYTTVVEDNAEILTVRDNTPIEPGKKRFIRTTNKTFIVK